MEYRLTTPCTAEDLAPLKAGDTVLLSGVVYTARDQAHRRMTEALEKGEPLPFDLTGSAIYYVGPTPERPGPGDRLGGTHHQRPYGRHEPPVCWTWQQDHDRQGQAGRCRKGGCGAQRGLCIWQRLAGPVR